MILGSSRAEKIQPSYLQRLTGLAGFNAAVSSGTPDDAWAFANVLHEKAGGAEQRVLWLLDVEAMRRHPMDPGLLGTPSLARFVQRSTALRGRVQSLWSFASWRTAADSWRSVDATLFGTARPLSKRTCSIRTNGVTEYARDGYRSFDFHDVALRRGMPLARSIAITLAEYKRIYQGNTRLAAPLERRFEETVATMNSWNIRPVIVLTPVHPAFARAIGPIGWTLRHHQLLDYLKSLRRRLSFDLLDASDISVFGGRSRGFYDGVHMKVANVQRLVDWVVRKAGRDLRPGG
jgi:hypothetical protein